MYSVNASPEIVKKLVFDAMRSFGNGSGLQQSGAFDEVNHDRNLLRPNAPRGCQCLKSC